MKHSGTIPETYYRSCRPNASPLQIPNYQLPITNYQFLTLNSQLSTI
ncbi:MAG: hypothetical protein HC786_31610 [Richelia sp. CSU_2_1]|nr:hypothetical protein [Richelia sp. CSU_2_1]